MQINLHQGCGLVSTLIKWQTRSLFSHASVTLRSGVIVEAREFIGVRVLNNGLEKRPGEVVCVFDISVTPRQEMKIVEFLLAQVGKPYDYLSITRFITRSKVSDWEQKSWFCSELVFQAFRVGGIEMLSHIAAWEVSPGLLSNSPLLSKPVKIHRFRK